MINPNRVSAGVPTGGEFARNSHAPADITLDDTDELETAAPAEDIDPAEAERPFRDWTPTDVDTEIVKASSKVGRAEYTISRLNKSMDDARNYHRRGRITDEQLTARLAPLEAELARAETVAAAAHEELAPYTAEYRARGGWPRGWYVPGGHIHRSDRCSSLKATTQIGLVVELSGQTEDEIVDAAGCVGCTVCYPSAPVEILNREPTVVLADRVEAARVREERAAASQKKKAKAALNTLNWGGVPPVKDGRSEVHKVAEARSLLQSSIFYGLKPGNLPLNAAAVGRDFVEASERIGRMSFGDDPERTEQQIEKHWHDAQKVMALHAVLVEKKVELGETEADAIKSLNKSLVSSMKKGYGYTPNVEILTEEQIAERKEWAARALEWARPKTD